MISSRCVAQAAVYCFAGTALLGAGSAISHARAGGSGCLKRVNNGPVCSGCTESSCLPCQGGCPGAQVFCSQ